jgi:micrococcal nuclease
MPEKVARAAIDHEAPAGAQTLFGAVVRVVDGDTIHVQLGDRVEKVRYIGMNTPETHHPTRGEEPGGREAKPRFNRQLVDGQRACLELDAQVRDQYGRLLAYVWVGNVMVNAEFVRRGYAQVVTIPRTSSMRRSSCGSSARRARRDAGCGADTKVIPKRSHA